MTADNNLPGVIDHNHISVNALKVISRLTECGYQAYLVGGCVRDILLGETPKDFDVATDAHPEEVRDIFRNGRIIGRRFRIVHVRFGREIVEVTTFRAPHEEMYDENHSDSGMTMSDNIYGNFNDDVQRRDFAMNAIYYQPETNELIDLVDGTGDIAKKLIRTIGDPEERFREDPVRMLRAVRFRAKLGFSIEPQASIKIKRVAHLIQDVAPARLFEEILKLFLSGYAVKTLDGLIDLEMFQWIFPDSGRAMTDPAAKALAYLALASTDRRIAAGSPVTPAFVLAALFWHPFLREKLRLESEGETSVNASLEAANSVLSKQQLFTSIPKRFSGPMRDIWFLQFRLPLRQGKKPDTLLLHKRFRAAYDFLLLREESGELEAGLGSWWTQYQLTENDEQRAQLKAGFRDQRTR